MKSLFLALVICLSLISPSLSAQNQGHKFDGNHYETFTNDGAWCWFSDPRAVILRDKIYSGWVTTNGSIVAGSYNIKTREVKTSVLYTKFDQDDHSNPSFLILPDERIMVFFSAHSSMGLKGKKPAIWYSTTTNPGDITSWEDLQMQTQNTKGWRAFCYTNPVMLSDENNRIFLFWRGGNSKPTFCYTDNQGKSWSKVFSLISSNDNLSNRPYMKVASNGKDEIHFAFTDGHPRNEPLNSIYYCKYKAGRFYKADGSEIGSMETLPLNHNNCDVIYDAHQHYKETANGNRAWIWDVTIDAKGNPVAVYTRLPEETKHQYYYACWNGSEWVNHNISNAGSSMTRIYRPKEKRDPEPHYSGGVVLDHENPNIVYYSKPVNDIFEIFKAETSDLGKTWKETPITTQSKKDNVRPFAIRRADSNTQCQILWMYNDNYLSFVDYQTRIKTDLLRKKPATDLSAESITTVMKSVADWQIAKGLHREPAVWTNAALYAGMAEWAKIANDSTYFKWLIDKGQKCDWSYRAVANPLYRYHADNYAVGIMYVEIYREFGNKKMIKPMQRYFDYILKHPSKSSLKHVWKSDQWPTERWSWCDALFMAPTVWAKMANELNREDYLKFMDKEYKATYKYLYDKDEHLFYRDDRYFSKKEANGKKVFWGRGNGWVLGGLPIIIQELPDNFKNKEFYENLFVEMAIRVASLQDKNGYWHASLLDTESYPNPETSGSGFYTYALAWGINNGYLDKEQYLPVVKKAWQALVKAVYPDGKLGWVQPIGADPKKVTQDMTEVYGVGAFLLAGSEMIKLAE